MRVEMVIDPDVSNAERLSAPIAAAIRAQTRPSRRHGPPLRMTRHASAPGAQLELAQSAIGLVPEARQTYPEEDEPSRVESFAGVDCSLIDRTRRDQE